MTLDLAMVSWICHQKATKVATDQLDNIKVNNFYALKLTK